MELYILRHAEAVERASNTVLRDADRYLTENGVKKMTRVAKAMGKMELSFDTILSSPYVRARDTAAIVGVVLDCSRLITITPHLAANANPETLVKEIVENYPNSRSILLVGHEPFLSGLISILISGRRDSIVTLKKSGLAKLSVENMNYGKCAVLDWLMGPAQVLT